MIVLLRLSPRAPACYGPFVTTLAEFESAFETLSLKEQEELLNRLVVKLGSGRDAEQFPVREDHRRVLDERFAAYRDDPTQASTWEDVKRRFAAHRG